MSLEAVIEKLAAAVEANTAAILAAAGNITTAPVEAKPAKTAKAAKPAPEAKAADEPPAAPVAQATKKEVVDVIVALAKGKGREVASKLLAEYGATRVPELVDETKFTEIVAKANKLLAD